MNVALALAAAASLATWGIHTFVGGPEVAKPLLASDLRSIPKYTAYYCWHIVTIVLFAMAAAYAYAAWIPEGRDVAILVTALSGAFAVWSGLLVVSRYPHPLRLPQWSLFLVICAAGVVGLA